MYSRLEYDKKPLTSANIFYKGDTSIIYKEDSKLYKVFKKKDSHKLEALNYLLDIHNEKLDDIAVFPDSIFEIEDNYGITMDYINANNFRKFLKDKDVESNEMLSILRELSDNLKIINSYNIKFSDLHHNNILINKDGKPLFIDLDDASIKNFGSTHINLMTYYLHNLENKPTKYMRDLIKNAFLDRESLTLMLVNYIFENEMQRLNYEEFNLNVEQLSSLPNDLVKAIRDLKQKDDYLEVPKYKYYIGDFIDESLSDNILKVKQKINGHIIGGNK